MTIHDELVLDLRSDLASALEPQLLSAMAGVAPPLGQVLFDSATLSPRHPRMRPDKLVGVPDGDSMRCAAYPQLLAQEPPGGGVEAAVDLDATVTVRRDRAAV